MMMLKHNNMNLICRRSCDLIKPEVTVATLNVVSESAKKNKGYPVGYPKWYHADDGIGTNGGDYIKKRHG